MNRHNIPSLLIKAQLLSPIELALTRIQLIRKKASIPDLPEVLREGAFALAWASFENALLESLREVLLEIPQKLPQSDFKVNKSDIVADRVLEQAVDRCISGLQSKGLREFTEGTLQILSVEKDKVFAEIDFGVINEIKQSRNLLLHNNLIVNDIYLANCGAFARALNPGDRIPVSNDYLSQAAEILTSVLQNIYTQLERKYAEYTRVKALRNLWAYCLNTPMALFDDYWAIDADTDMIRYRVPEKARSLSHSERSFLAVWLQAYTGKLGRKQEDPELSFSCLTSTNFDKHLFLIKALAKLELGRKL